MSGIDLFNFPAFDAAAADLRSQGVTVISPTELDREAGFDPYTLPNDWNWNVYPGTLRIDAFLRDMHAIATCDAIHLLPGWQGSKGAAAERAVALWLGLAVFEYVPVCEKCRGEKQVLGPTGDYEPCTCWEITSC